VHGVEYPLYSKNGDGEFMPYHRLMNTDVDEPPYIVCDVSSNIATRDINWDRVSVIYAGLQKNLGPAGACLTIIRKSLIENSKSLKRKETPAIMDWELYSHAPMKTHNTPATWSIYVTLLNV
jgi:phosphoserine aminotransferase